MTPSTIMLSHHWTTQLLSVLSPSCHHLQLPRSTRRSNYSSHLHMICMTIREQLHCLTFQALEITNLHNLWKICWLALLGEHKSLFLFKHLVLQLLPEYVRAPLATSTIADYRQLAQEADKIYASGNTFQQHVHEVNSTEGAARPSPHVNFTRADYIPQQIIDNMCWYYRRLNQRARKCIVGCKHYSNFYKNQGNKQQSQK